MHSEPPSTSILSRMKVSENNKKEEYLVMPVCQAVSFNTGKESIAN